MQPLGVQFEDYTICESAVEVVCGVHIGHQVLNQQLTRPEEDSEEAEDKGTILDALQALELATQYLYQLIQRTVILKCATNLKMNYIDRELKVRRKHMQHLLTG